MTVAEVIAALQKCPQGMPVRTAYDSMVCVYDVEPQSMFMGNGVLYLCAMDNESIKYHFKEDFEDAQWVDPELVARLQAADALERERNIKRDDFQVSMQEKAKQEGRWTGYDEWVRKGMPI